MTIEFDKEYLRELYEEGWTDDRKHRMQPGVVRAYRKTVLMLMAAATVTDLYAFNGLHYKVLSGDLAGRSSVRINKKYRLEFTVREEQGRSFVTICTLLEISNHYQ